VRTSDPAEVPSDNPVDVRQKVRDWLEGGSRLVQVVAARATAVTVYRRDRSSRWLRGATFSKPRACCPV